MRINARLDEPQTRKLSYLKRVTGSGISEIVRRAIDEYYRLVKASDGNSARVLAETGLIGCAESREDLSKNYKEEIFKQVKDKHDHR